MSNQVVWPARRGNAVGAIAPLTQASTLEAVTILAIRSDGTGVDLSSYTLSATLREQADGDITAVTGTLTPANGSFTWTPSAADVGTVGVFYLQVLYTNGVSTWASHETPVRIENRHAVSAIAGTALLGVSAAEAAWLAAARAEVSDPTGIVAVTDPTSEQVGYSPVWNGAAWGIGKTTVQDYAISSLTAIGLVLPPNYENEVPVVLVRQYGDVNNLRGLGVGSTHTIRQNGLYNLSATVYIANATITGAGVDVRFRKNRTLDGESGTLIGWEQLHGGALSTHTITVTATGAYLVTTDTVHLTIQHTHSAPITFGVLRYYVRRDGQVS